MALALAALLRSHAPPPLFWVLKPTSGCRIGVEGLEVVVHFNEGEPIDDSSFRALLNGADVTGDFLTGSNGATAQLFGVLDGVNTLHLELRPDSAGGKPRQPQSRDLTCLVRLPQDVQRG